MNKPLRTAFIASLIFFACALVQAEPERLLVTGVASNLKTGKVVYREYHDITKAQHTVRYVDEKEKLIASKTIQYLHGFSTPEYQLQDQRVDRKTGSEWKKDHFIIFRQEASEKRHEEKVDAADDLVIDAGFDHFIRTHWETLIDGKVLPFSFAIADPLTTLHMQLTEVTAAKTAIKQHNDRYRYFLASSRNKLISWAIPDINLAYDRETRLIQVYQGPSNITDQYDKTQNVTIRYEYQYPDFVSDAEKRQ